MALLLHLAFRFAVDYHPKAPSIWSSTPGGVVKLSLSLQLGFRSTPVLVGGAIASGVTQPLEVGNLQLDITDFALHVSHCCLQCLIVCLICVNTVGV